MTFKLRDILLGAALASMVAAVPMATAQDRAMLIPDARENVPAGLIGVWEVDPALSPGSDGRTQLRSFHYGADGTLMVNFYSVTTDGSQMFGHWAAKLDGSPALEYRSDNGSTPIAVIRLRMVDQQTFALENYYGEVLQSRAEYHLSDDGQTLTLKRLPLEGGERLIVYRKWMG